VGGSIKVGAFTPMFQFHTGQRASLDRRHWLVGTLVKARVGEVRAAYSRQDDQSRANVDRSLLAVGYDYPLSHRTLTYTTVVRDKTSKHGAQTGIELGLRHSF
jgi:hypothetical protein